MGQKKNTLATKLLKFSSNNQHHLYVVKWIVNWSFVNSYFNVYHESKTAKKKILVYISYYSLLLLIVIFILIDLSVFFYKITLL